MCGQAIIFRKTVFFFNYLLLFFAEKRARLNRNIILGKIVSEHEKSTHSPCRKSTILP